MNAIAALQVLREFRTDQVVLATMGSSREWLKLSKHPRDFIYVPSSMSQAPTLGLGLAVARPDLRVIVLNGDGCMLMNLGCLVTIAEQAPPNYALVVFNNGVYEVTGGQPVAGAGRVDFSALARVAGFPQTFQLQDLEHWRAVSSSIVQGPGLAFAELMVDPITSGDLAPRAPCPMPDQITQFRQAIATVSQLHERAPAPGVTQ
jgi:thiamine pyrophosphate-dependent acetolactate synthase large subunit-like protein